MWMTHSVVLFSDEGKEAEQGAGDGRTDLGDVNVSQLAGKAESFPREQF